MRRDQNTLKDMQKENFRTAVNLIVESGGYQRLLNYHHDPAKPHHNHDGSRGLSRFLAWHRRFLLEFEILLKDAQRNFPVPPASGEIIDLPYWRWPDPFPEWLNGFTTRFDTIRTRVNAHIEPKPTVADVLEILNNSHTQVPGEPVNDYVRFTYTLQGYGKRANGTALPGHNHMHRWVNGIMDDLARSPADPVFWLVHAEVDRLWHIWHSAQPQTPEPPPFEENDATMDPWEDTYDDLDDISLLGYQYDTGSQYEPPAAGN